MPQFIRVSETLGLNLDHITLWQDQPERDKVTIITVGTESDLQGAPYPHQVELVGAEREMFLMCLKSFIPYFGPKAVATNEP